MRLPDLLFGIATAFFLASCVATWPLVPGSLRGEFAITIVVLSVAAWAARRTLVPWGDVLALVVFGIAGATITASVLASLPRTITQIAVWRCPLAWVCRFLHYGLVGTMGLAVARRWIGAAEAGIWAVLVYGLVNGQFFALCDERFFILTGIVTLALARAPRRAAGSLEARRVEWFAAGFLGWAFLTSFLRGYVHANLEVWVKLATWYGLCHLVVRCGAYPGLTQRLTGVTLGATLLASWAGFAGAAVFAAHTSWRHALMARLSIGGAHPNASGIVVASALLLALGARRQGTAHRSSGVAAVGVLGLCTVVLSALVRSGWQAPESFRPWVAGALAGVLAGATVVLSLRARRHGLLSAVAAASIPSLVVCLALTYSRSAAAGLVAGVFALCAVGVARWTSGWDRPLRWAAWSLVATAVVVGAVWTVRGQQEATWRMAVWSMSLRQTLRSPLGGLGLASSPPEAFDDPLPRGIDATRVAWARGTYPDPFSPRHARWHPHDVFLHVLQGTGFVGLLLLCGLLGSVTEGLVRALRRTPHGACAGAMAALVALMVPHLLVLTLSAPTLLPMEFWFLVGMLLASFDASNPARGGTEGASPPRLGQAALGAIAMLVFVARPLVAGTLVRQPYGGPRCGGEASVPSPGRVGAATWLSPLNAELRVLAGDLDPGGAIERYREACRLRPSHPAYEARLGWLLVGEGRFEEGKAHIARAARTQQGVLGPRGIGEAQDLALPEWVGPSFRSHHADLATLLVAEGRVADAAESFAWAVALSPEAIEPGTWVREGNDLWVTEAVGELGRVPLPPAAALLVASRLGRASDTQKHPPRAGSLAFAPVASILMDSLARPAWGTPTARAAHVVLVYEWWGIHEKAYEATMTLRRRAPPGSREEASFTWYAARALAAADSLEAAAQAMGEALRATDGHAGRSLLATIHTRQGDLDLARRELERAAQSWDPGVPATASWWPVWRDLGALYQESGSIDDAARAYAMAHFLLMPTPHYAERLLGLARAAYGQAQYDVALRLIATGVEALHREGRVDEGVRTSLDLLASETVRIMRRKGVEPTEARRILASFLPRRGCVVDAYRQRVEQAWW